MYQTTTQYSILSSLLEYGLFSKPPSFLLVCDSFSLCRSPGVLYSVFCPLWSSAFAGWRRLIATETTAIAVL